MIFFKSEKLEELMRDIKYLRSEIECLKDKVWEYRSEHNLLLSHLKLSVVTHPKKTVIEDNSGAYPK